jgi:hypothetical protein
MNDIQVNTASITNLYSSNANIDSLTMTNLYLRYGGSIVVNDIRIETSDLAMMLTFLQTNLPLLQKLVKDHYPENFI